MDWRMMSHIYGMVDTWFLTVIIYTEEHGKKYMVTYPRECSFITLMAIN